MPFHNMDNMTIKQLQDLIMQQAEEKGFGTEPEEINVAEKIALIQQQRHLLASRQHAKEV